MKYLLVAWERNEKLFQQTNDNVTQKYEKKSSSVSFVALHHQANIKCLDCTKWYKNGDFFLNIKAKNESNYIEQILNMVLDEYRKQHTAAVDFRVFSPFLSRWYLIPHTRFMYKHQTNQQFQLTNRILFSIFFHWNYVTFPEHDR